MGYSIKEQLIKEYIAKVNFKKNWSYKTITTDLKKFLGEIPGFDVDYVNDVMMNEDTGDAVEIKRLQNVIITFVSDVDDNLTTIKIPVD
jgi:hypothetical protein